MQADTGTPLPGMTAVRPDPSERLRLEAAEVVHCGRKTLRGREQRVESGDVLGGEACAAGLLLWGVCTAQAHLVHLVQDGYAVREHPWPAGITFGYQPARLV